MKLQRYFLDKMELFIHHIKQSIQENMDVKSKLLKEGCNVIAEIALEIVQSLKNGYKILLFGNGGSAADAQHIAAELVGRFSNERPSLPAIALTANTSTLTAIGNDYGYEYLFSRQIEGIGKVGDIVIGISTSGKSPNVLLGIKTAKKMGIKTVAFTGGGGGTVTEVADISFIVPSRNTQRIQETHIMVGHILCELIEKEIAYAGENKISITTTSSHL